MELPELNTEQRFYLQSIFDYFHTKGAWPTGRHLEGIFYKKIPELNADEILATIPSELIEARSSSGSLCSGKPILTVLGMYLCQDSEEDLKDFLKVLQVCINQYLNFDDDASITSDEICQQLNMSELAVDKALLLLQFEPKILSSATQIPMLGTRFGISNEIRRFQKVETIEQYLEKREPALKMLGKDILGTEISLNNRSKQSVRSIAITGFQFEDFVRELLQASGFTDVQEGQDQGFDYLAFYPSKSPNGTVTFQKWIVEVKYYGRSRVRREDLDHLIRSMQAAKADKALFVTNTNLTSFIEEFIARVHSETQQRLEVWDGKKLASLIAPFPGLQKKYASLTAQLSFTSPLKPEQTSLIDQLDKCRFGQQDAKHYADICIAILINVFATLKNRVVEEVSFNGFVSFCALFSMRYAKDGWIELRQEFDAKSLFCVFKNDKLIDKETVIQVSSHLNADIGRIAIIFGRKGASDESKEIKRKIYRDTKKAIFIFEDRHLHELLDRKENNQDPLDVIFNAVDILQYLASKESAMQDDQSKNTISVGTKGLAKNKTLDDAKNIRQASPWVSGSFYLVAFVVVIAALIAGAMLLPWYALPIVLIGGTIILAVIGAFQLRQDEQLSEKNFLELMALSFKYLPLLKRQDAKFNNASKK